MYRKIPDRETLHARAAILAAEDELSDIEIAQRCGITRRTLIRWKKQPAIQKKINEHLRLIQLHSEVGMISERQNRVLHLEMKFQDLQGIIRARASSPEMRGVPGGSTGLMRRSIVAFSQRHGRVAQYNYRVEPTQPKTAKPTTRKLSAAARTAMSAASKKRWAAVKAAKQVA